jgi:hypothetical protein
MATPGRRASEYNFSTSASLPTSVFVQRAAQQDGDADANAMARFLAVLKPREPVEPRDLILGLDPLLQTLEAEVDHRTPAHLSAMLRSDSDNLRLQFFADVQAKANGPVLELVLMSREAMGRGAPLTLERFERLLETAVTTMTALDVVFRSDRDGPLPDAA